tara:strand:+ start:547 stop:984 length:438 start_codon:yes stop_codon:yes gene_type:complete
MIDTRTNPLPDMTDALKEVKGYAKGGEVKKKNGERWQDDDGDGKWYEKSDVDGKISKREKEEKKKKEKEEEVKESMLLTRADKKGNTPAWQNRDKKNPKTGKPIYKKADHLNKEEAEIETLKKMELFSDDEIQSIVDKMDFSGEE